MAARCVCRSIKTCGTYFQCRRASLPLPMPPLMKWLNGCLAKCGLTRWPAKWTATQHMDVQMKHSLTNTSARINVKAEVTQTVFHLHIHVLGGRPFSWPPG